MNHSLICSFPELSALPGLSEHLQGALSCSSFPRKRFNGSGKQESYKNTLLNGSKNNFALVSKQLFKVEI